MTSGKNFPATGPLGPVLVTTDEIGDPTQLTLVTRLNGEEMQRSGTDRLIYSIPQIIKFVSDFTASRRATSSPRERRPASAIAASRLST